MPGVGNHGVGGMGGGANWDKMTFACSTIHNMEII